MKRFIACLFLGTALFADISVASASSKINIPKHVKASLEQRPFADLIEQYAKRYKVPVGLAHAIIFVESRYNPEARGKAGEIGLMQLMPMTARGSGFKGPLTDLYKPHINLKYGMLYLSKAHALGRGSVCRTILKYNAGYSAKKMNPVSLRYCKRVKQYLGLSGSKKFRV